jgi:excisionase family DNA binding protein
MSTPQSLLIRLVPKRKRVIAEVGNAVVHETVFTMERASGEEANLVRINHQQLLPRSTSEYITINEAAEETGLSESRLRELAREEGLEAIKLQSGWLILRESLYQYMKEKGIPHKSSITK